MLTCPCLLHLDIEGVSLFVFTPFWPMYLLRLHNIIHVLCNVTSPQRDRGAGGTGGDGSPTFRRGCSPRQ